MRRVLLALAIFSIASSVFAANTGFVPLNDLGSGQYLNQYQGGLYPGGSNTLPAAQAAAGLAHAAAVTPRDINGIPSPTGKYVLLSIGLSNTTQEWCSTGGGLPPSPWTFMGQAAVNSNVNHTTLAIANGALGGKSSVFWDSPPIPIMTASAIRSSRRKGWARNRFRRPG